MKRIIFKWCGSIFNGTITSQKPSPYLGQATNVTTDSGIKFTFYGKCEVGPCGPFNVLLITQS